MATTTEHDVRRPPQLPPAPAPRNRRRSYAGVWLLVLAGLGFGGYRLYETTSKNQTAGAAKKKGMGPRAVSVVTTTASSGDVPVYLRGLGSVTAFNTVTVKSRVDGQLMKIYYTEGQLVHQGEVLAEIDPRPFQVQLDQAQGQLARDQAQLRDAQVNLARYQTLWNEQVIPKQQLDTQAAQVGQFEGAIQSDQANINNAKLQLTYSKITAPLTGRIGLRLVDVGNIVHASDPNGLVVITQVEPIAVLFAISADQLQPVLKKLRAGQKLRVDAYDRDDRTRLASGTLLTVDNQIDQTTGTYKLKAVFDNRDGALFPNQFVNCRLLLDTQHNIVIVPAAAIQRGPDGTFVYTVSPTNTATVRPVTVGITEGDSVSITSGLSKGDPIIIEGQDKLQEGSKLDMRAGGSGTGGRGGRGGRAGRGGAGQGGDAAATGATNATPASAGGQANPAANPAAGQAIPGNPAMGQPYKGAARGDQQSSGGNPGGGHHGGGRGGRKGPGQ